MLMLINTEYLLETILQTKPLYLAKDSGLCNHPNEDVHHLLPCPYENAAKVWKVAMTSLNESLANIQTDSNIVEAIICFL